VTTRFAVSRPARLTAPPQVIVALTLLGLAVSLLEVTLETLDKPTYAVVWGSIGLACYAASLLCLTAVGQGGLGLASWRLGPWILLWYGLAFGLATMTWIQPQTSTSAQIRLSAVLQALALVAVGMTCWAIGYFVGPGTSAMRLAQRLTGAVERRFTAEVRSARAPWTLYAVGLAARLTVTVTTGRLGYVGDAASAVSTATGYGQILSLLALCAPLAISVAALRVFRERQPGAGVTLAVLFLAELGFGAAAGGKQSFVITVLAVVVPMTAEQRRLPRGTVIAGIIVFLVVVVPFNRAYRGAVRGSSVSLSPRQALHAAPEILRQTVSSDTPATVVPDSVTYLLQRIREIDSPAIILQRTPAQIGFSSPTQLVEAPIAEIVPRAVWPGKPIVATGYEFSQQYYGLPATLYTSSAITPVGDLYRHGGWLPVIVGMFLLGCLVRLLDEFIDVRRNPHSIFLLLLFFPTLVKSEDDWSSTLAGFPTTIAFWLLAVSLAFRRQPA
jgi:hypothetical protein